jgi:hypothetical protein
MDDEHRAKKRRVDRATPSDSSRIAKPKWQAQSGVKRPGGRGASYRPSYSSDWKQPTRKIHVSRDSGYPKGTRDQPPEYWNSYRPGAGEKTKADSRQPQAQPQRFQSNNHSTKTRKTNPSTRIRSLRKQLAHASAATLPANILAEKERELQYLIDSREDTQTVSHNASKRDSKGKKMLSQYHMVRFFERKKAERNLKRARKRLQDGIEEGDEHSGIKRSETDNKEVQGFECDLLYCLYAPLGEKYIALFAGYGSSKKSEARKASSEDKGLPAENPHIIRLSRQAEDEEFRSPHWYTIQNILHHNGTESGGDNNSDDLVQVPQDNDAWTSVTISQAQVRRLEALRDGKDKSSTPESTELEVGLAVRPKQAQAGKKRKAPPSWQDETDEPIDPMDADDSDNSEDGGVLLGVAGGHREEDESNDEFFE